MPSYRAPLTDMQFVLNDLLALESHRDVPGFEEITPELVNAILEECARISEEVLQPLNCSGDSEGCRYEDGNVYTPAGFKAAYDAYAQGGWTGLTGNPEFGGQGLPHVLGLAVSEMSNSANMAFSTYPGLTPHRYT